MVYLLCNQYDKMKILWFTGGTSLYANKNTYNGGGWVASLQQALINNPNTDRGGFSMALQYARQCRWSSLLRYKEDVKAIYLL